MTGRVVSMAGYESESESDVPLDAAVVAIVAPLLRGRHNTTPTVAQPNILCQQPRYAYEIVPAVICGMCFVFGILYTFFGYRFFKAVMFLTGFIFGSVVTYMICLEKNVLPTEGSAGIAVGAGVLCGLITMLVQYVGLFLTGFHLGVLLALSGLVVLEQFIHPDTKWIAFGSLFIVGVVFALLTLYFQKALTMVGTSAFGSAMMVACLDYFVDSFMMVFYLYDRIRVEVSGSVCWFSWLILGCWPVAAAIGLSTQYMYTGKGINHQEAIHSQRRRKAAASAAAAAAAQAAAEEKARLQQAARERTPPKNALQSSHHPLAPSAVAAGAAVPNAATPLQPVEPHTRYRQLYQVRRFNGDIISQSYIKSVENKLSPALKNMITASENAARSQVSYTPVNELT